MKIEILFAYKNLLAMTLNDLVVKIFGTVYVIMMEQNDSWVLKITVLIIF
jgi:hypothetical protein